MKRRLFEDLVVSVPGGRTRGGLAVPVSVTLHAVGVAALLALPVFTTEALPDPPTQPLYAPMVLARIVPLPPPVPVAPPVRSPAGGAPRRTTTVAGPPAVVSVAMPTGDTPTTDNDTEMPPDDVPFCLGCNAPPTIGIGPAVGDGSNPAGGPGVGSGPVPVTSLIRPPTKLRDARPVYPEMAKMARVQGPVVIECIIAPDGRVDNVPGILCCRLPPWTP